MNETLRDCYLIKNNISLSKLIQFIKKSFRLKKTCKIKRLHLRIQIHMKLGACIFTRIEINTGFDWVIID